MAFLCHFLLLAAIPGTMHAQAILYAHDAVVHVAPGTLMRVNGDLHVDSGSWTNMGILSLKGDLQVDGSGTPVSGDGTWVFSGNARQHLRGDATVQLGSAILFNTSDGLELQHDLGISGMLHFLVGDLHLNGHALDLGQTGALGYELPFSRAEGTAGSIISTRLLDAPNRADIGNLGAVISSPDYLGWTTVERHHQTVDLGADSSIARAYRVQTEFETGLDAELRLAYRDTELNGISEEELVLFHSSDALVWDLAGGTPYIDSNFVAQSAINPTGWWTMGHSLTPLPVELLFFEARVLPGQDVELHWATATETQTARFDVYRSNTGFDFLRIGHQMAAGYSSDFREYTLVDEQPGSGTWYYQLLERDLDGDSTWLPVRSVFIDDDATATIAPNPVSSGGCVDLEHEAELWMLFTIDGREVQRLSAQAAPLERVCLPQLPSGVYVYRWRGIKDTKSGLLTVYAH